MAFGSVTFDHADPSTHTVLTCPIDLNTNASALDFVCFRGRYGIDLFIKYYNYILYFDKYHILSIYLRFDLFVYTLEQITKLYI